MAEVRLFAEKVAARHGWLLNRDRDHVTGVLEGLDANRERLGYYLCPCRDGAGERSADSDVICPCPYAVPDIAEHGHCYCGLFVSPSFDAAGRAVEPIPERRTAGRG
jgi:ferredoxin-thioredoxin reductase catalytic chain